MSANVAEDYPVPTDDEKWVRGDLTKDNLSRRDYGLPVLSGCFQCCHCHRLYPLEERGLMEVKGIFRVFYEYACRRCRDPYWSVYGDYD